MLRFSCVAYRVCLWRRQFPRFARPMTTSLIASLLLHCKRRVPVAPPVPSLRPVTGRRRSLLRFSCVANGAYLWRSRFLHFAVTGRRRSLLRFPCVAGTVAPFALLVARRRRSLLRFSCVTSGVCLWRCRSLRFARHMTASLIASLLLRCKRRVPVAPSVPSLRSSHDGVAHCFASLALRTACACGAVGSFASLVI